MSTYNRLDLQTLGPQLIKNLQNPPRSLLHTQGLTNISNEVMEAFLKWESGVVSLMKVGLPD